MRRLFANLTDGLFGYRLRYKSWRRWPLLVVLFLVWFPLSFWVAILLHDAAGPASIRELLRDSARAEGFILCGVFGQGVVNGIVLVFVPLFAARAFARERAGGNMMDLVLLPVTRRKIVLGRLSRAVLPFVLLILWSLPAYLAIPMIERHRWGRIFTIPLVWTFFDAPHAFLLPLGEPHEMGLIVGHLGGHLLGVVPWLTVLSAAVLLAVLGFYFSLRLRSPMAATMLTYLIGGALLAAELLPSFLIGPMITRTVREIGHPPMIARLVLWFSGPILALLLRVLLPLLLLRSAIRNFDRWALGEK